MDDGPEQNGFTEFITWEAKSRDTIDFKTIYVDMAGDLMAGLMLSQIIYWYLPDKRGRSKLRVQKHGHMWLVKARDDWWTEIRLTARQADRTLAILREKGLITTSLHRFSGAPTTHIRLNKASFLAAWNEAVVNDYSNLPNGEFTKPLIQEGGNLPNGDMELSDPVNSLTETTAETTVTETTILPAPAEIPPSQPDPVLSTDNPQSVSNDDVPEGAVEPRPSEGSYLEDVNRAQGRGPSPTVPPAAGGADSFNDGPVKEFCALIGFPEFELPDKKRGQWASELRSLASEWQIDARILADCIEAMPQSEFGFKAYSSPYQDSFKNDVSVLIGRHKAEQPLVKEKPGTASTPTGNLAGMKALAQQEGWYDGDP